MKTRSLLLRKLILYGILCAIFFVVPCCYTIGNGWIAQFRCERLERAVQYFKINGKFDFSHMTHTLGYVLYFPLIMEKFSIQTGKEMYCLAQSVGGMIVITVFPIMIYKIFRFKLLAVVSPAVMHFTFGNFLYIDKAGEYFSGFWAIVAGSLLLILFIDQKQIIFKCAICTLLAFTIMLANVMRGQSGLPLLIVFMLVLVWEILKGRLQIKIGILMIAGILLTSNFLGTTIPSIVAAKWGFDGVNKYNSSPWHSILIGMGYIENDYGLYYSDDSGRDIIEKLYPDIVYNSDEYYEACKEVAINIIKTNPGFWLSGLMAKFLECTKLQMHYIIGILNFTYPGYPYYIVLLAILVNGVLLWKHKLWTRFFNMWRGKLMYIFLMVELSLYSGVLSNPNVYYIWGGCRGMRIFNGNDFICNDKL